MAAAVVELLTRNQLAAMQAGETQPAVGGIISAISAPNLLHGVCVDVA
jgi:hypothetical protein